jgi:hypothetical protein
MTISPSPESASTDALRNPEAMSEAILALLTRRPGVRALAVVGARAGKDPTRIDRYSDLDLLICCDDDERAALIDAGWCDAIAEPVMVFPRIMTDEVRILFDGLFACELHFLSPAEVAEMSGPCRLGGYLHNGFAIVHDPEALFAGLAARLSPEPEEEPNPGELSSVFWYNLAFCANLILRGDHFRAVMFSHWYLQLWLLELVINTEGYGWEKYVERQLTPEQYAAFAATIGPLTHEGMRDGLLNAMRCYWFFQRQAAPELDPELLERFHRIEAEVVRRFADEPLV